MMRGWVQPALAHNPSRLFRVGTPDAKLIVASNRGAFSGLRVF
jgi:hypothetical protein